MAIKGSDLVLQMLGERNCSYSRIAEIIFMTSGAISNKIRRNSFRLQEFMDIADALGYDVKLEQRDQFTLL